MRTLLILISAFIVVGQFPQDAKGGQEPVSRDAEVIESTILWRAELDEVTWTPIELNTILGDTDRYTKKGNFYKVKETFYVFGHEALYVGMLGVEMVPGPNAVLRGDPSTISGSITKQYQIAFAKNGNSYIAELMKHVKLIVTPHPKIYNATIVIGGYFGP